MHYAKSLEKRAQMAEELVGLHILKDFISLILWTGQLFDERPTSAIIVAPPGAGKTSIMQSLECDTALFVGDLTARNIAGIVTGSDKITHIMLGDMLSIFGHKGATVQLTLRLLSQMTGEVLKQNPWTGVEIPPRMIGLVTAIPPDDIRKYKKHITSGGFASRFMIARYNYKASTVAKIHDFIANNGYQKEIPKDQKLLVRRPHIESAKLTVAVPVKISEKIKTFALSLKDDPLGFRAHRHLRALVKASARRQGRLTVTEKDFEIVEAYCDFFAKEGKDL